MVVIKKIVALIVGFALFAIPAVAGGPDERKLPEMTTIPKAEKAEKMEMEVIEPIRETDEPAVKKEAVRLYREEEIQAPEQPSNKKPGRVVERVVVREPVVKKKFAILFESDPPNADVVVNGLYVGSTPVQIPLSEGVYNVKIMLSGHDAWEQQVKAFQGLRVLAMLQEAR
jgi:hypothetical protein